MSEANIHVHVLSCLPNELAIISKLNSFPDPMSSSATCKNLQDSGNGDQTWGNSNM